jgi:DNA-binding MarR family transcriptional regulator
VPPTANALLNRIHGVIVPDLKQEIAQQRPFSSVAEEALLNLMRTADCLGRFMQRTTRRWGITSTQYNVLRILRGAHPKGLTCSGIGDRMITADPDITRLLSRLKALKLLRQERDKRDRRVVWTHISPAGLELLAEMDPVIQQSPVEMMGHLNQAELVEFVRLLELARARCNDSGTAATCEGNGEGKAVSCDGAGNPAEVHPATSCPIQ